MTEVGVAEAGRADAPSPLWDGAQLMLLASIDELEVVSRFAVQGMIDSARRMAGDADALHLPEVRLRAELIEADVLRRQGQLSQASRMAQGVRRWASDNGSRRLLARSGYILAAVFQEL